MHGYGIIKEVAERTGGAMDLETGTLYAAIKRLRDAGWIDVADAPNGASNGDSRRRYYQLTELGRDVLKAESDRLAQLVRLAEEKNLVTRVSRAEAES